MHWRKKELGLDDDANEERTDVPIAASPRVLKIEELCGELEGLVSNGVNGKSNNVFARDIELDELAGALSFAVGLHSLFPPLTGGAAIELGKLFSKDFGGSGHHLAMGSGGEDEEED